MKRSTVNVKEILKFTGVDWNSAVGASLLNMHTARMKAIGDYFESGFEGLRVLDMGCGSGLVSSSLVEMGAKVVAADIVPENVELTLQRVKSSKITGRVGSVEDILKQEGPRSFDAVISLEVIEHVDNQDTFVNSLCDMSKNTLVLSTINRTIKSYALAILAAEHATGMVPVGTHDWFKFVKPEEIERIVHGADLHTDKLVGLVFNPVTNSWCTSNHLFDVNFMYFASRSRLGI